MPLRYRYIENNEILAEVDSPLLVQNNPSLSHITPIEVWIAAEEVQLWRLRTILKAQGLFTSVQTVIANIPDPSLKLAADEGFEYGNVVSRTSPIMMVVQQGLGLTDDQVDQIFIAAEQING
jgi:hypothetical protein